MAVKMEPTVSNVDSVFFARSGNIGPIVAVKIPSEIKTMHDKIMVALEDLILSLSDQSAETRG
jgi:hypothetical protein